MAYYNNKKVLSVVKVAPILNLNEGGEIENNTLLIDETFPQVIATFNNVDYHYCISVDEDVFGSLSVSQGVKLPSKEIISPSTANAPSIDKFSQTMGYLYILSLGGTPQAPIEINLNNQTTGEITLPDTTLISNAYIINENGHWILFYNLS